jgi:uncharacterized protein with PQ loop repeat
VNAVDAADILWAASSVLWFLFWPPTLWKVYKTKDVGGLSLLAWSIEVGATGFAAVAGAIWGHWSVVASMGCFCLLSIWLCALIVRYRR